MYKGGGRNGNETKGELSTDAMFYHQKTKEGKLADLKKFLVSDVLKCSTPGKIANGLWIQI